MKALYKLVFIACLIASSLFSQDKSDNDIEEISQEEWNDIVDYVNAEVTGFSMEKYKNSRKRIEPAEQIDLDKFNKLLESNSREEPIPFSEITIQLEKNWRVTYKNISQPIDSLKSYKSRIIDSLFYKIESIKSYKTLKLNESSEYTDLKNELLSTQSPIIIDEDVIVSEDRQPVVVRESTIQRTKKRSLFNYWMIPTLLFLISTIVLFVMWSKARKSHENLEVDFLNRDKIINRLKIELRNSENRNEKLETNQKAFVETQRKPIPSETVFVDEPKAPEIELIPVEKPKVPQVLYAGKPTTEGKFSPVSSSPLSGQTIYKLKVHEDGLSADFEIELVDQFITREVTNAPDEYLYRVCNQENSNKDFSREIITTKKGLAILIDGNWVVKEANKATIKFQ